MMLIFGWALERKVELDDVALPWWPTLRMSALVSPMKGNETLPWVIFRTMEFWLMSSEKVEVGLRTVMVRAGLIVSHGGALK